MDRRRIPVKALAARSARRAAELGDDISDTTARHYVKELRKKALTPDAIARAIAYAVEQPDEVDVNEVIVRPTVSTF